MTGFEAGADDYIIKPFSLRELVARVKVGLRRCKSTMPKVVPSFGDIVIDTRARRVTRGGSEVTLTRREFDILEFLARHPGEVIARDKFCDDLWGEAVYVTERVPTRRWTGEPPSLVDPTWPCPVIRQFKLDKSPLDSER